jgi:hypothetical protein
MDERQREIRLNSLESAAVELDNLVSELLYYVRWEAKQPPVDDEGIELLPLVEDVVGKYTTIHPSKQFSIGENLGEAILISGVTAEPWSVHLETL